MKHLIVPLFIAAAFSFIFMECTPENCLEDPDVNCPNFNQTEDLFLEGSFTLQKGFITWNLDSENDHYGHTEILNLKIPVTQDLTLNGALPVFEISFDRTGHYSLNYDVVLGPVGLYCESLKDPYFLSPPKENIYNDFESGKYTLIFIENRNGIESLQRILLEPNNGRKAYLEIESIERNELNDESTMIFKSFDLSSVIFSLTLKG